MDGEDRRRVAVAEAAQILGVSVEAVRGRIKRGTLLHERDSGTVYVLLSADQFTTGHRPADDQTTDRTQPAANAEMVEELRDRVRFLEGQLEQAARRDEENRRVILALTSRIPAIEASQSPQEPSEGSESRHDTAGAQEDAQGQEGRPWWKRIFGGE